jgi:low affinity Fe/Cu permease
MREFFGKFATRTSEAAGSYWAFLVAVLIIIVWGISGPAFGFSDTWQLVINTGTTIVTFLMVFLIQNSQNRESRATQLKLDELIRAVDQASNRLIDIEEGSEEDLERLKEVFRRRAERVRAKADGSSGDVREAAEEATKLADDTAEAADRARSAADQAAAAADATSEAASAVSGTNGSRRSAA